MDARVSCANGSSPVLAKRSREGCVSENRTEVVAHLRAVVCNEIVGPFGEETFDVAPWRRDHRDPARECFEWTDRRNAGEALGVESSRNVYRHAEARKQRWNFEVRN